MSSHRKWDNYLQLNSQSSQWKSLVRTACKTEIQPGNISELTAKMSEMLFKAAIWFLDLTSFLEQK